MPYGYDRNDDRDPEWPCTEDAPYAHSVSYGVVNAGPRPRIDHAGNDIALPKSLCGNSKRDII